MPLLWTASYGIFRPGPYMDIAITTLMENTISENRGLLCEHGLSFHVRTPNLSFLFDCGATDGLVHNAGLLNTRQHTSNGPGFLEMFAPGYKGQDFYIDKPSLADDNLITAGCTGALLWAKQIIERLGVFDTVTLESWYEYFNTGKPEHFYALMQSLPTGNEN